MFINYKSNDFSTKEKFDKSLNSNDLDEVMMMDRKNMLIKKSFIFFINCVYEGNNVSILELPYFIDTINLKLFDLIDDRKFIEEMVKLCLSLNDDFSKSGIYVISTLLLSSSLRSIDLIFGTSIQINENESVTFPIIFPYLCERFSNDEKTTQSLLYCIPSINLMLSVPSKDIYPGEIFSDFIFCSLHSTNINLQKTAADVSLSIIRSNPNSSFSNNFLNELPFDSSNREISQCCFAALGIMCGNGNCDCFDISHIIKLTQTESVTDALYVLGFATKFSSNICLSLLQYINVLSNLLKTSNPRYVCLIICNIVNRGTNFALPFLDIIPELINTYYNTSFIDKEEISLTIALILKTMKVNEDYILFSDS